MSETLPTIGLGSEVRMHLSITLEDGTEALSTFGEAPIQLRIGDGTLVEGLELALIGLGAGARQRLHVEPQYAYGLPQADRVQTMDPAQFPAGMDPQPGLVVGFTGPDGAEVAGTIHGVGPDGVRVDFNHPLAGHELIYEVEILEVVNPTP
ncbi:MAG: hypothetical protein B7Z66_11830 [Chromatiales bacterium 21-64-14]|nr:MAG: hypothetical protein B7Z66_11830 [Chromatiales bacterium 21-64-14]HQU16863.1 FKBP-type peptidyl-prolyl cis-trans isomerase [Gammaproteobacteria bacterium]